MKRYFTLLMSILLLWASFSVFAQTSPSFLFNFGSLGSNPGQFNNPTGIATSSNGNIYVLDRDNARIAVFNSSGTFLFSWGEPGGGIGQFNSPVSIAIDGNDRVYVAGDASEVEVFDANGQFIT